jgi:hypothetical protein
MYRIKIFPCWTCEYSTPLARGRKEDKTRFVVALYPILAQENIAMAPVFFDNLLCRGGPGRGHMRVCVKVSVWPLNRCVASNSSCVLFSHYILDAWEHVDSIDILKVPG